MANAFSDRDMPAPTPDAIEGALGVANGAWLELLDYLEANGITVAWKWYRDGGWLARAAKGSKTIFWAQIDDAGFVSGSFYFTARLRQALAEYPGIPPKQTQEILNAKPWGKQVSVPFKVRTLANVKSLEPLVNAKLSLK